MRADKSGAMASSARSLHWATRRGTVANRPDVVRRAPTRTLVSPTELSRTERS